MKRFGKLLVPIGMFLLLYTRIVGLDWGLPYPLHPDERNMADAMLRLTCEFDDVTFGENVRNCFNPEFWAYGQLPIYLAFGLAKVMQLIQGTVSESITFIQATMALRWMSVVYSVLTVGVLWKIVKKIRPQLLINSTTATLVGLILIFQPYAVQYAHFGTTESLLMLLSSLVVWQTLQLLESTSIKRVVTMGVLLGIAIATKVSSLTFIGIPIVMLFLHMYSSTGMSKAVKQTARYGLLIVGISVCVFVFLSPQTMLHWADFTNSMRYEISVGNGDLRVFYTRQFEHTIPVVYQFAKVFPYALGLGGLVLFFVGLIGTSWKDKKLVTLKVAFIVLLLPASFVYAKWARFAAPMMPVMTLISILGLSLLNDYILRKSQRVAKIVVVFVAIIIILPGIAYGSVYTSRDVRFTASEWMLENIEPGSDVLIETGNVINLPIRDAAIQGVQRDFTIHVVDFYNIETSLHLQEDLTALYPELDYIVIASRRVFANHTCQFPAMYSDHSIALEKDNALVSGRWPRWCQQKQNDYFFTDTFFTRLFAQQDFQLVATFDSYPRINIGQYALTFRDELAEEAWTVFDHPVIRVYKKSSL